MGPRSSPRGGITVSNGRAIYIPWLEAHIHDDIQTNNTRWRLVQDRLPSSGFKDPFIYGPGMTERRRSVTALHQTRFFPPIAAAVEFHPRITLPGKFYRGGCRQMSDRGVTGQDVGVVLAKAKVFEG